MPSIETQTDYLFLARNFQNYYDCSSTKKWHYRRQIKRLLAVSDLKFFCDKIGLKIQEIKLTPNDDDQRFVPTKLNVVPMNVNEETRVYKYMIVKDLLNISDKKYILLRKFLKINYIDHLPGIKRVNKQKTKIDESFILYYNDFGFFFDPAQKIKFVCEKFLERNAEFAKSGTKKFKIKLCADGVTISKKNVQCLTFAFTLLSDIRNCTSVFHTYLLGKYCLIRMVLLKSVYKFLVRIKKIKI